MGMLSMLKVRVYEKSRWNTNLNTNKPHATKGKTNIDTKNDR